MARFRHMGVVMMIAAAAALALMGQNALAASNGPAVLKVASVNASGGKRPVLVDGSGRAVYLLTGDSVSHPTCTDSACLGDWPPVTTDSAKPTLGAGIKGKLTVWKHGHFHQLVLNGHPLYTFAGDSSQGKASGQGLKSDGGVWELLTASGSGLGSSGAKTSSTSTSSSSGGGW